MSLDREQQVRTVTALHPSDLGWETRPHSADEPARHCGPLTEVLGLEHSRANLWRYDPGASGRWHRETVQEETFVVIQGTLSIEFGDTGERRLVTSGGVVHVPPTTPFQLANVGDVELLLYAHGSPPEAGRAEFLER
jgi:mannose-6-phosphate isomerase-like protein (cupin superfamily)